MFIAPKLSEVDINPTDAVLSMVTDRVEIQMLDQDIMVSCDNCMAVVANLLKTKELKYVVLHMPFGKHALDYLLVSVEEFSDFLRFTRRLRTWAEKFEDEGSAVQFSVLLHHPTTLELWNRIPDVDLLMETLVRVCKSKGIRLLLENSSPDLHSMDKEDILKYKLLDRYDCDGCYDVCHAAITERVLGCDIDQSAVNKITWIHFSACLEDDGVKDKKTHGRRHEAKARLALDIVRLMDLGFDLDNVTLCLEIGEEDYNERPDQLQEFVWLTDVLGE